MKEKKTALGNRDEKEKSRELSPAEERRLRRFEELSDSLIGQGYRRVELTVSIVKANIFAVVLLIPLLIAGIRERGPGKDEPDPLPGAALRTDRGA